MMGASDNQWALPRESPQHKVKVDAFYMDVCEVTNAQFSKFVDETGYLTIAERPIDWDEMKKQLPPLRQSQQMKSFNLGLWCL